MLRAGPAACAGTQLPAVRCALTQPRVPLQLLLGRFLLLTSFIFSGLLQFLLQEALVGNTALCQQQLALGIFQLLLEF